MIKDKEVAMVAAGHRALEILKLKPTIPVEEIIQEVIPSLIAKTDVKIAAIAAITGVVKLKREKSDLSDRQAIQNFINSSKILDVPKDKEDLEVIEESLKG